MSGQPITNSKSLYFGGLQELYSSSDTVIARRRANDLAKAGAIFQELHHIPRSMKRNVIDVSCVVEVSSPSGRYDSELDCGDLCSHRRAEAWPESFRTVMPLHRIFKVHMTSYPASSSLPLFKLFSLFPMLNMHFQVSLPTAELNEHGLDAQAAKDNVSDFMAEDICPDSNLGRCVFQENSA